MIAPAAHAMPYQVATASTDAAAAASASAQSVLTRRGRSTGT
ncbi:hypothetical protein ACFZAI_09895 [Achromobacter sp. NPDC008082]